MQGLKLKKFQGIGVSTIKYHNTPPQYPITPLHHTPQSTAALQITQHLRCDVRAVARLAPAAGSNKDINTDINIADHGTNTTEKLNGS